MLDDFMREVILCSIHELGFMNHRIVYYQLELYSKESNITVALPLFAAEMTEFE